MTLPAPRPATIQVPDSAISHINLPTDDVPPIPSSHFTIEKITDIQPHATKH